jgi:hypothetical protein
MMLPHGMVPWFVEKPVVPVVGDGGGTNVDGAIEVPMVDGLEQRVPKGEGETVGDGTAISGLTPALPISTDPSGIPVRETTLGANEGADPIEEAVALPAPHVAALPCNPVPAIPPPSNVLTPDIPPEIPVDVLPAVEQPIIPVGSVIIGLIPGEASSVAPSGIPVGPTDELGGEPGDMPSGEVAAMPGIGTLVPPTWASAELEPSITMAAAINMRLSSTSVPKHADFTRRAGRAAP